MGCMVYGLGRKVAFGWSGWRLSDFSSYGFGVRIEGHGPRVDGVRSRVQGSGCKAWGGGLGPRP